MLDRISSMIDEEDLQSYRSRNYCKLLEADFNPLKKTLDTWTLDVEPNARICIARVLQGAIYRLWVWPKPEEFLKLYMFLMKHWGGRHVRNMSATNQTMCSLRDK